MMRMMQIRRGAPSGGRRAETSRRTVLRARMRAVPGREGLQPAGRRASPKIPSRPAFTLVELIVTISIIALLAATALPTISGLFNAGADKQAYNIIAAQITAARALAIVEGTYAGVHVQIADRDELENICYAAVVIYDDSTSVNAFVLADGFTPQRMPGNIAFGELRSPFVDVDAYQNLNDGDLADFTTFTIVFSPAGQVVKNVNGNLVAFVEDNLFKLGAIGSIDPQLWYDPDAEAGATAITLFDYKTLKVLSPGGRADYLDENGQFLVLNLYTGQFFYRY